MRRISYKSLGKWFEYLEEIANLGCPNQDQILKLVEIKASRDILVHSNGFTNSIYVKKAGELARFSIDEKLDLPEKYHRESWQLIKQVVSDVAGSEIKKSGK